MAAADHHLRRLEGLVLGCAVLVTDAAANGYANYVLDSSSGTTAGRIGQAAITVLAIALLAVTPRVCLWFHPTTRTHQRNDSWGIWSPFTAASGRRDHR